MDPMLEPPRHREPSQVVIAAWVSTCPSCVPPAWTTGAVSSCAGCSAEALGKMKVSTAKVVGLTWKMVGFLRTMWMWREHMNETVGFPGCGLLSKWLIQLHGHEIIEKWLINSCCMFTQTKWVSKRPGGFGAPSTWRFDQTYRDFWIVLSSYIGFESTVWWKKGGRKKNHQQRLSQSGPLWFSSKDTNGYKRINMFVRFWTSSWIFSWNHSKRSSAKNPPFNMSHYGTILILTTNIIITPLVNFVVAQKLSRQETPNSAQLGF